MNNPKTLNARIRQRIDTSAAWAANPNTELLDGELGFERCENGDIKLKIGRYDHTLQRNLKWSELDYWTNPVKRIEYETVCELELGELSNNNNIYSTSNLAGIELEPNQNYYFGSPDICLEYTSYDYDDTVIDLWLYNFNIEDGSRPNPNAPGYSFQRIPDGGGYEYTFITTDSTIANSTINILKEKVEQSGNNNGSGQFLNLEPADFIEIYHDSLINKDIIRTTLGDATNSASRMIFNGDIDGTYDSEYNYTYIENLPIDMTYDQSKEYLELKLENQNLPRATIHEIKMPTFENTYVEAQDYSAMMSTGDSMYVYLPYEEPANSIYTNHENLIIKTYDNTKTMVFTPIEFTNDELTVLNTFADYFYPPNMLYSYNCANPNTALFMLLELMGMGVSTLNPSLPCMMDETTGDPLPLSFNMEKIDDNIDECFLWVGSGLYTSHQPTSIWQDILDEAIAIEQEITNDRTEWLTLLTSIDTILAAPFNLEFTDNNFYNQAHTLNDIEEALLDPTQREITNQNLPYTVVFIVDNDAAVMYLSGNQNMKHLELYTAGRGYKTLPDNALRGGEFIKIKDGEIDLKAGDTYTKNILATTISKYEPSYHYSIGDSYSHSFNSYGNEIFSFTMPESYTPEEHKDIIINFVKSNALFWATDTQLSWDKIHYIDYNSNQTYVLGVYYNVTAQSVSDMLTDINALIYADPYDDKAIPDHTLIKEDNDEIGFALCYDWKNLEYFGLMAIGQSDNQHELKIYCPTTQIRKIPASYIDLSNITVTTTDTIELGNTNPPTSDAVAQALATAGAVTSVNGQTGDVSITIPTIPTVPRYLGEISNSSGFPNLGVSSVTTDLGTFTAQAGDIITKKESVSANSVTYYGYKARIWNGSFWKDLSDTKTQVGYIDSNSTHATIPTSKAVYDFLQAAPITTINANSTDNTIPSSKAVYDLFQSFINDVLEAEY